MATKKDIKPILTPIQSACILSVLVVLGLGGIFIYRGNRAKKTRETITAFEEKRWDEGVRLSFQANRSTPAVQRGLGMCYLLGLGGLDKNYKTGYEWLEKAASGGDAEGAVLLGHCYLSGMCVERNPQEAVKWFRMAAEKGNVEAQYCLGLCYTAGKGIGKDMAQGVLWFRMAAEKGNVDAQYALGGCYIAGKGVDEDMRQGVEWLRKAAESGHALAQKDLGICYWHGMGVESNKSEARKWFDKAIKQGNSAAKNELESLEQKESEKRRSKVQQDFRRIMTDS